MRNRRKRRRRPASRCPLANDQTNAESGLAVWVPETRFAATPEPASVFVGRLWQDSLSAICRWDADFGTVGCTNTIPLQIASFKHASEFVHPTRSPSACWKTCGTTFGRLNE